jgi:hypothetical protein
VPPFSISIPHFHPLNAVKRALLLLRRRSAEAVVGDRNIALVGAERAGHRQDQALHSGGIGLQVRVRGEKGSDEAGYI